jgi:hypothetical protein
MGTCLLDSCLVQVKRETDLNKKKYVQAVIARSIFREELLNYQIIGQ